MIRRSHIQRRPPRHRSRRLPARRVNERRSPAGASADRRSRSPRCVSRRSPCQRRWLRSLKVIGRKYATTDLNVRAEPKAEASVVTVIDKGTKVAVTKTITNGFRYVSYRGKGRWVKNKYLSETKPKSTTASSSRGSGGGGGGGISGAPCPGGSSVESGLTPDAIRVHRALCHRYPQFTSFLGRRSSSGYHGQGRALDCMISNTTVGWNAARWLRANAKSLGVMEVIYRQQIWTVQRSSDGWRPMSDRGSPTANHMDHVHVSVYGNSGSA